MQAVCGSVEPALSQNANADISMVTLHVQPGQNGGQMVLTPKGVLVPLPGPGVDANSVDIYMGSSGGYWYVAKDGENIDLTGAVQAFRSRMAEMQTAQTPPYAPYQMQQNQGTQETQQTQETQSSGGGSGAGAVMATAAAAGLGAMAGSAMTNGYYNNVPYGTRMYYGANGNPYYRNNGNNVFVNQDGDLNYNNIYAANQVQNNKQAEQRSEATSYTQAQQQARQQATQSRQQTRQAAYQPPQAPTYAQPSAQHQQNFQEQSKWYQSQQKANSERAQSWKKADTGANPFVRGNEQNFASHERDGERRGFGNRSGGEFQNRRSGAAGRGAGRIGRRGR